MKPEPIYTYGNGTPIEGYPGPPPEADAPVEERIAWLRARADYRDRVASEACRMFAGHFNRKMREG